MVVILPFPNGICYSVMDPPSKIFEYKKDILNYVNKVCMGPWSSNGEDLLQRGLRVRIGDEKDLFLLKMKYGLDIIQNV